MEKTSPQKSFKVLLILNNALGHSECHEFNNSHVKVVYLPPNTTSLIQPPGQRVIRTFSLPTCSMERTVSAMEENPDKETITTVRTDYTLGDTITIQEKAVTAIKPQTINSCRRKLCPDVVHDLPEPKTEPIKEMMKDCGHG